MPIVILRLPDVKRKTETRPRQCPYCTGDTFQRGGKVRKAVRDNRTALSRCIDTFAAAVAAPFDTTQQA